MFIRAEILTSDWELASDENRMSVAEKCSGVAPRSRDDGNINEVYALTRRLGVPVLSGGGIGV